MNIAHRSLANTWSNISSEKRLLMLSVSMIKPLSAKIKFKYYIVNIQQTTAFLAFHADNPSTFVNLSAKESNNLSVREELSVS